MQQDGEVVHAAAGRIDSVVDALQAEVLACTAGVKAAVEHGMGRVIIETIHWFSSRRSDLTHIVWP
jgi:hypothetical protein